MNRPRAAQAGRAVALVATAAALLATAPVSSERLPLDASTSCGPAALVTLREPRPGGCGGHEDSTWDVDGGAAAGLPPWAEPVGDGPGYWSAFVLAGPVALPGAQPPVTVHRVCQVSEADAGGVRTITCAGDAPEAACSGTLTVHAPDVGPF